MEPLDALSRSGIAGSEGDALAEPISPELALVDPELAERARRALPGVYVLDSFGAPPAAPAVPSLAPAPELARRVVGPFPSTRSGRQEQPAREERPGALRYAAVAAVLALLLAALGGETYLWTASVRAGGPPPLPQRAPPRPAPPVPVARIFSWPPAPGAAAYRFSLLRGGTLVLSARTRAPRFALPERWSFQGRGYLLVRGAYVWTVRPLSAPGLVAGPPLVRATYEFAP